MTDSATFAPLKNKVFRGLWISNIVSNFGGMVQAVGAAWLMTTLVDSEAMVALVQASTTLPIMFFALIAGALADNMDRRKVLLAAQGFMLIVSVLLVICTWLDMINAWSLLAFTFLIGCGAAFNIPSWQASVGDIVGKDVLPSAVVLNGMGFNVTRSVAPAIGGVIVAGAGAIAAFAINAVSYLGLIFVVWRWRGAPPAEATQRETLGAAIYAGLRYVALSPHLTRVMFRGLSFGLTTIVVLAFMPLIGRELLGGGPVLYGALLCAFGAGAVGGGLVAAQLRKQLSNEALVRLAFTGLALCAVICSVSSWVVITALGIAIGGAGWVLALSMFNTSVQISTPRWVVGRALSLYQMAVFGGMALGAWFWGNVAESLSIAQALQIGAATMLVGALLGLRWPLPDTKDLNLDPLNRWQEPAVKLDIEARSGPVSIAVLWLIKDLDVPEFKSLMVARRQRRRRNGAQQWTLLRDMEQTDLWVERFELPTWGDYVRFHARTTQEEAVLIDRLLALHQESGAPRVVRLLTRDPGAQAFPGSRELQNRLLDA